MPGYQLVEERNLQPYKNNGVEPYENEIGFLDFLREIGQEPFPFSKFYRIKVVGLEEVLYGARPREEEMALKIYGILRGAAQELEKNLVEAQIVFRGKLTRADKFWSEYSNVRLPVGHIFGSPIRQTDVNGNPYYKANFNLTNG